MTKIYQDLSWKDYLRARIEGRESNVPWVVVDKLAAYDLASSFGVIVPNVIKVLPSVRDFCPSALPETFVCKPTSLHSMQGVMVLRRLSDGTYFESLRKRKYTSDEVLSVQQSIFRKISYSGDTRLIIEDWIHNEMQAANEIPIDYKFYCYGDKITLVTQIDRNTTPPTISWAFNGFDDVDIKGRIISKSLDVQSGKFNKPKHSKEMLKIAKHLAVSLRTPFVRVDLYDGMNGPVFGEFTLTPGGPYFEKTYKFTKLFDALNGTAWQMRALELAITSVNNDVLPPATSNPSASI